MPLKGPDHSRRTNEGGRHWKYSTTGGCSPLLRFRTASVNLNPQQLPVSITSASSKKQCRGVVGNRLKLVHSCRANAQITAETGFKEVGGKHGRIVGHVVVVGDPVRRIVFLNSRTCRTSASPLFSILIPPLGGTTALQKSPLIAILTHNCSSLRVASQPCWPPRGGDRLSN